MEGNISGGTYWLYIDPAGGSNFSNIVCLTDHSFTINNTTSTRQTYCGTKSNPGDQTQSISLNGEIMTDADTGDVSAPDIFSLVQNKTTFTWKISPETVGADDFVKTGSGYFSAYTENYTAADVAKFSATISVDGNVTQTYATGS
jgi:hypothetical protein